MGKVYLIGGGPSDIGLFTLKGKAILEKADVVVYDALVSAEVLMLANENATFIDVGKRSSNHRATQEEINHILVEEAQKNEIVVRLKGGDPFLFGRGGEELELLAQQEIPFEVVPGVTSSIAVPAYNGIPVTYRDFCSSLHIITGHKKSGEDYDINFKALVETKGTLVFLMGVSALEAICNGLMQAGMREDMPAAVLQKGTTAQQKRIVATVKTLQEEVERQGIETPAIIVVGEVCSLAEQFGWYEKLPLAGKRVLVPRPKALVSNLAEKLRTLGAQVVELSTIKIEPIHNEKVTQAFEDMPTYQWVVLTSPSGVTVFFEKWLAMGKDLRSLCHVKFAVVGLGTKKALQEKGIVADCVPDIFDGAHLAQAMIDQGVENQKVMLVRATKGRQEIVDKLRSAGAKVTDVATYDTVYCQNTFVQEKIKDVEYILFTSSSSVEAFVAGNPTFDYTHVKALCIGAQTEATAKSFQMCTARSQQATLDSLLTLLSER